MTKAFGILVYNVLQSSGIKNFYWMFDYQYMNIYNLKFTFLFPSTSFLTIAPFQISFYLFFFILFFSVFSCAHSHRQPLVLFTIIRFLPTERFSSFFWIPLENVWLLDMLITCAYRVRTMTCRNASEFSKTWTKYTIKCYNKRLIS